MEITRRIFKRFNDSLSEDYFPIPESIFNKTSNVLGADGKKMSKSKGNFILPSDVGSDLIKKVRKLRTDSAKTHFDVKMNTGDSGNPSICSVYTLHDAYSNNKDEIYNSCATGNLGCGSCKNSLATNLENYYGEFREKQEFFKQKPEYIREIIAENSKQARLVAYQTLEEVKDQLNLF